jgi:hypothetical protein
MIWPRKKKRGRTPTLFADPAIGMELARRIAERNQFCSRGERSRSGIGGEMKKAAPCPGSACALDGDDGRDRLQPIL